MSLREDIQKELVRGVPRALILDEPFDAETTAPARIPLRVTGWGREKGGITYNVFGWSALPENTEFYIVELGEDAWAIPVSTPHTKLVTPSTATVNSLTEVMESFLYQVGVNADEEDIWGEEPEGGW